MGSASPGVRGGPGIARRASLRLIPYKNPITVGHRHRYHYELHIFLTFVCQSMRHSGWNMPTLSRSQAQDIASNFQTSGT